MPYQNRPRHLRLVRPGETAAQPVDATPIQGSLALAPPEPAAVRPTLAQAPPVHLLPAGAGRFAARLVVVVLEVAAGLRHERQLADLPVTAATRRQIAQAVGTLRRARATTGRAVPLQVSGVRICDPVPGAVYEVCVLARHATGSRVCALRVESPRTMPVPWYCTAFTLA